MRQLPAAALPIRVAALVAVRGGPSPDQPIIMPLTISGAGPIVTVTKQMIAHRCYRRPRNHLALRLLLDGSGPGHRPPACPTTETDLHIDLGGLAGLYQSYPDEDKYGMADLCAGLGGFSHAAETTGIPVVCALDLKSTSAHAYEGTFGPGSCWVADITDPNTLHQVAKLGSAVTTTGFNCQPYAYNGSQRGTDDTRADVLLPLLIYVMVLRPRAMV